MTGTDAERLPVIAPMLSRSARPFDSSEHQFEIKWDGTRCIAYVEARGLRMLNRRGVELRGRYPELDGLRDLPAGTIVDGEIVVLESGRPSFPKLQQREHVEDPDRIAMLAARLPATYMVFDLLYANGVSRLDEPLAERRRRLEPVIADLASPHVLAPEPVLEHGIAYFQGAERAGLEGIMAKRLASAYQPGKRTDDWLKIKVEQTGVFDVIGYVEGETAGVGALVIGQRAGARWISKGKVGTGFTDDQRRELLETLRPMPALERPPKDGPAGAEWRATGLRCRVRYFEKTVHGMLRGPVFVGFTEDDADAM